MKTVVYRGPAANLGRFGFVEDGAHLQVSEREAMDIADDPRFELISRRKPARDIPPLGTPDYDLRDVQWDHPKLDVHLQLKGPSVLRRIAAAMSVVGASVAVTVHDNSESLADRIAGEARSLGWDKYDAQKRRALGGVNQDVSDAGKVEPDPVQAEDSGEGEDDTTAEDSDSEPEEKPVAKKTARKQAKPAK